MYPGDEKNKDRRMRHVRHRGWDYEDGFADPLFKECRDAIVRAFKTLRSQNVRTRANYMCCGGCACSAISTLDEQRVKKGQKPYDGAVYWHRQSEQGFRESGSIYVYFCVDGKFDKKGNDLDPKGTTARATALAQKLVAALKAEDLDVTWDGDTGTAVLVDGFTEKYWREKQDKAEFKENIRDAYSIAFPGRGV